MKAASSAIRLCMPRAVLDNLDLIAVYVVWRRRGRDGPPSHKLALQQVPQPVKRRASLRSSI